MNTVLKVLAMDASVEPRVQNALAYIGNPCEKRGYCAAGAGALYFTSRIEVGSMHRVQNPKRWLVHTSFILCAILTQFGTPSAASALSAAAAPPEPAAPSPDVLEHARDQFNQALSLQTSGDWAFALALLKEVASIEPTPQVRFNIALCEEHVGRLVSAIGDYELAASESAQVAREVDARLAALKAREPRIVVQRGAGADAATISLDGVPLGDTVLGVPLQADPGPHVVEAKAPGFQSFKQVFRIAEMETSTILVKLEATPAPVVSNPPPKLQPAEPGLRSIGFVVAGVGIASLTTAGVMFTLRHTAIADLDKQCGSDRQSCPDSSRSIVDHGKLYTTLADVTLALGALGLGAGAALVLVGGHSAEQASVAIAPGAPSANAGATLFGRF